MTMVLERAAPSYSRWCRNIVAEAGRRPGAMLLFDSGVDEPTALLRSRLKTAFGGELTSAYGPTFPRGNARVVTALAKRYGVDAERITCTTGASNGLAIILQALVRPGDHVLVELPHIDLLPGLAGAHGARLDHLHRTAPSFAVDEDMLAAALQPSTRAIVLTNLHNPSGVAIDDETLRRIAALADRVGATVIVNEVYGDFIAPTRRSGPAAGLARNIVSTGSLSKVYGLFALKCGWIIADGPVQARINAVYDQFELGLSKIAQSVAALVLEDFGPFEGHALNLVHQGRGIAAEALAQGRAEGLLAGHLPADGCMVFPQLLGVEDDAAFAQWLWEIEGVAVAPGSMFGQPGHIRLGFGSGAARLTDGYERLLRGLRRWRNT